MNNFCFVRGCEKLAKIEVLFSDRHGVPVCDKHIDGARCITYEATQRRAAVGGGGHQGTAQPWRCKCLSETRCYTMQPTRDARGLATG